MKYFALSIVASIFFCLAATAQNPKKAIIKENNQPVFFIDSVSVSRNELGKYDPNQISSISVLKGEAAKALLGENGKDGIVFIETKAIVKNRYWKFLSSISGEYAKAVPTAESDSTVQYILDGDVLTKNADSKLATINKVTFRSISVINKEELQKKYGISGKSYGVVIKSDLDVLPKPKKD